MKKTILAAAAMLTLASCAKENSTTELIDPNAPVAATFTSAAITRVSDSAWEAGNQIGITMVKTTTTNTLATGSYENVPYTVDAAGTSGTFSADDEIIYFPVDGTEVVDFIAYYPYTADSKVDADKNIAISVADQEYAHIDVVAAKAVGKTKSSGTVVFANDENEQTYEAFSHQLSKLTMTIVAGDGVGSLDGLVTTIKGQKTTAKFNIYSFGIGNESDVDDITAITTTKTAGVTSTTVSEAILLPTEKVSGSTIEFKTTDGNVYILDTSNIAFAKGAENKYEITLMRTGAKITSSTINNWGTGDIDKLDATEYEYEYGAATISATYVSSSQITVTIDNSAISDAITFSQTFYRKETGATNYTSTSTNDITTSAFIDVSPNTEYEIYVLTVYADGAETKSNVLYITTLQAS